MSLLGIPSLIVGIILLTAGTDNHWFSGAHTVGLILTIVSAAVIVIGFSIMLLIGWAATSTPSRRRRW